MKSRTTEGYRCLLDELLSHFQEQARRAYDLFRENPHHPSLRFSCSDAPYIARG